MPVSTKLWSISTDTLWREIILTTDEKYSSRFPKKVRRRHHAVPLHGIIPFEGVCSFYNRELPRGYLSLRLRSSRARVRRQYNAVTSTPEVAAFYPTDLWELKLL